MQASRAVFISPAEEGSQIIRGKVLTTKPESAYEVVDTERGEGASKDDLDPGLTANLIDRVESPHDFLQRVLLDGEEIVATFDCQFPGEFVPMWKLVLMCLMTMGMYLVVLAYRWVRRLFYRWRLCTPALVSFSFGKMAVTNKGRIVCWQESVLQEKVLPGKPSLLWRMLMCPLNSISACCCGLDLCIIGLCTAFVKCLCRDLCQAPVRYETINIARVYRTSDVRQTTQFFTSEAACVWCCLDYAAGIEVSFNSYNHGSDRLQIASRTWFSADHFGEIAPTAAGTHAIGAYYFWARGAYDSFTAGLKTLEGSFGATSNLSVVQVLSNTGDRVHNGDVDAVLRDLCALQKRLLECLPPLPDAIVPETVGLDAPVLNVQFSEKFKLVTVVNNSGAITIPREWLPLLPGETIVSATGQVNEMDCVQWFWSIVSCGFYYVVLYRRRKYTRSALVLTSKRLISMDIYERSGTIPLSLSNFSVQVRSYILGYVASGYIKSSSPFSLEAGIEASGGAIRIKFCQLDHKIAVSAASRQGMAFARAMQMSALRPASRLDPEALERMRKTPSVADSDLALLPLLGDEGVVDWVRGDKVWEPCLPASRRGLLNMCRGCCCCDPVAFVCSHETLGEKPLRLFPCLPLVLTCALRPLQTHKDIIVTDMSVLRYARSQNFGICGAKDACTTLSDNFIISWEPLEAFSGFNVVLQSKGAENCFRRLVAMLSPFLSQLCCPLGSSEVQVGADFRGKYQFVVSRGGSSANHLKAKDLKENHSVLSGLQLALAGKAVAFESGRAELLDALEVLRTFQPAGSAPGDVLLAQAVDVINRNAALHMRLPPRRKAPANAADGDNGVAAEGMVREGKDDKDSSMPNAPKPRRRLLYTCCGLSCCLFLGVGIYLLCVFVFGVTSSFFPYNGYSGGEGSSSSRNVFPGYSPGGVAVDNQNRVYVASLGRILMLDTSGTVFEFGTSASPAFSSPYGLAVDAAGNVYVADTYNSLVRRIDATTQAVTTLGTSANPAFSYPNGVAVDAAGNVYVASSNLVRRIASNGAVTTLGTSVSPAFSIPYGVAVDAAGNVYVADTYNSLVRRIDAITEVVTDLGTSASPAFNRPKGVAVDAVGNVYVADTSNSLVRKIAASNGAVTTLGTSASPAFKEPLGVAVDTAGNVYVVEGEIGSQVLRFIDVATGLVSTIQKN